MKSMYMYEGISKESKYTLFKFKSLYHYLPDYRVIEKLLGVERIEGKMEAIRRALRR